jgi:hypothetical protein
VIAMRIALTMIMMATVGCGGGEAEHPHAVPPKRPNNELVVGDFARKPPDGVMALRFRANGGIAVGKDKTKLDAPEAEGTFEIEKDQMTVTFEKGEMCPADQKGVYKVVISKLGIRFTKVEDECAARARWDGSTFWRL